MCLHVSETLKTVWAIIQTNFYLIVIYGMKKQMGQKAGVGYNHYHLNKWTQAQNETKSSV